MGKIKNRHFLVVAGLILADGLFFGLTDPNKVSSLLLIVGFILAGLSLYYLFRAILAGLRVYGLPIRHNRRLAVLLGVVGMLILALQSIGELTRRDVLVMVPLSVVFYLYLNYGRSTTS